jgi:hypothetical protein
MVIAAFPESVGFGCSVTSAPIGWRGSDQVKRFGYVENAFGHDPVAEQVQMDVIDEAL